MPSRILVVEDEPDLRTLLESTLRREGFEVTGIAKGADALEWITRAWPDVVLLDLMLPDISGTELCRRVRRGDPDRQPIIIVVSALDNEIDRVVAFEVGADDYVTKPFNFRELVLRVRANLRRREVDTSSGRPIHFERAGLRIEPQSHSAFVHEAPVELTPIEFRMLLVLIQWAGRTMTRDALMEGVWGTAHHITIRAVDTHVKRLRHKLGAAALHLRTVRGVGYRFDASN